jgi:predicted esterase
MTEHISDFTFQGRYYTEGEKNSARQIWFVLHGYGQLAKYFIRKFSPLLEKSVYVIAPEALSNFYLENVSTRVSSKDLRVGASWMTRENREYDMLNYISFLNSVYEKEIKSTNIPVTILGFSQGAATASRWVLDGKINFEKLILWAGMFPPDIDFNTGKNILQKKETVVVYGTADPFLTDTRFTELALLTEKLSIHPRIVKFEGGHDIEAETLLQLL